MKKIIAAVFAILALLVPSVGTVVAQQQSGQGLEISPPLIEQQVDPGQTISFEIRVRNLTNSEVIAKGALNDFEAKPGDEEGGYPNVITDENAEPSPYSFRAWVKNIPDLRLAPREAKTAVITVNVPRDAAPGGKYGVVRFTATPVDIDETGVALSASIGTLVLLNVSGDVNIQGSIEEFSVSQNGKQASFFETGPVSFVERIKNSGNTHFKPQGVVVVKDTFGKEVANFKVNENGGNILPGSIRKFEQTLDKKNLIGRYKAELNLNYGNNQTLSQTITFWVVPYKIVLAILAGLILLITLIVFLSKRYKKHVEKEVHEHDAEVAESRNLQHKPGSVHEPAESSKSSAEDSDDAANRPPTNPIQL